MIHIKSTIIRDAEDDVSISITGYVDTDLMNPEQDRTVSVVIPKELKGSPAHLKLTGVIHSIQESVSTILFWENEEIDSLILPIEGRGFMDLSKTSQGGISNPRGTHSGNVLIEVRSSKPGKRYFMLTLEMVKQRN